MLDISLFYNGFGTSRPLPSYSPWAGWAWSGLTLSRSILLYNRELVFRPTRCAVYFRIPYDSLISWLFFYHTFLPIRIAPQLQFFNTQLPYNSLFSFTKSSFIRSFSGGKRRTAAGWKENIQQLGHLIFAGCLFIREDLKPSSGEK
jgi:hypothetical protein